MATQKKILGDLGEKAAARSLSSLGLKIIARNWRCRFGELDIVAAKQKGFWRPKIIELVFVEVKSGFIDGEIGPEKNITFWKKQKMARAIQSFLSQNSRRVPIDVTLKAVALVALFNRFYLLEKIEEYPIFFYE